MKRIFLCLAVILGMLTACSDDDSFTTSRSHLLSFATDTVKMDTVFSNVGSRTYSVWVFNHSGDGLRISSVRLKNANQPGCRVNVDGTFLETSTGSVVHDLELRSGDSLRVYVELTAPENHQPVAQSIDDDLLFTLESGAEQRLHLHAYAWDAISLRDLAVHRDTVIESSQPLVFYGEGIRVDSGAVLTIRNTTLYFHDKAGLKVGGTLITDSVVMRGDRLDHMFDYLPYDRVSGQWEGVYLEATSTGNILNKTEIRNTMTAVHIVGPDSAYTFPEGSVPRLTMNRCVVHNAKGDGIVSYGTHVLLNRCQITNALNYCLAINGGRADIDHCTLAQFYPLNAQRGAALYFNAGSAGVLLDCSNSIVTGYDADVVMGERSDTASVFQYFFTDCLLRTPAVEDDTLSFKNITWEKPSDEIQGTKHFVLIDEHNMIYNFRLDSLSTAKGKGCY